MCIPACWSLLFKVIPLALSMFIQASIINGDLGLSLCSITRIQNVSIDFFYFTVAKWILIHKRKTLGVKCQLLSNILLSPATKIVCISSWKYNVYVFSERISIKYWCEVLFFVLHEKMFRRYGWGHKTKPGVILYHVFYFVSFSHRVLIARKCGGFSLCLIRK